MDIAAGAVLLGFAAYGAYRGLFRSVAGLLVILAALVGACVLTSVLTPAVSEVLQPVIERRVQVKVDSALGIGEDTGDVSAVKPALPAESAEQPEEEDGGLVGQLELSRLLRIIGMDGDPTEQIRDAAREKARDTGVSLAMAVIESVAETVLRTLIFALSFVMLVLVLKLITHAVDLALKLPGLHLLNRCGGFGIGIVEGALVLFLGIWLLRRFGVVFDTETVESTVLLSFFTTHTPLSVLSFL